MKAVVGRERRAGLPSAGPVLVAHPSASAFAVSGLAKLFDCSA
jgi:hypothetical protein